MSGRLGLLAVPLSEMKALEGELRTHDGVKFLKCESGFCESSRSTLSS